MLMVYEIYSFIYFIYFFEDAFKHQNETRIHFLREKVALSDFEADLTLDVQYKKS